ncbi:MAG: hypothetical protein IJP54_06860 [Synergistaceae bacterium]|nr:hypothetical protein [Synergistaceae bacterium]MBR0035380.1 hypothetical protein [Synergistaceae bacterium]
MRKFVYSAAILLYLFAAAEGSIISVEALPNYEWQKKAAFPDWTGRTDDTLALNSIMGFYFLARAGKNIPDSLAEYKEFRTIRERTQHRHIFSSCRRNV